MHQRLLLLLPLLGLIAAGVWALAPSDEPAIRPAQAERQPSTSTLATIEATSTTLSDIQQPATGPEGRPGGTSPVLPGNPLTLQVDPVVEAALDPDARSVLNPETGRYEKYIVAGGMTEVSDFLFEDPPTSEQAAGAAGLRAEAQAFIRSADLTSLESIKRAGFELSDQDNHWVNVDNVRDGVVLDVDHPEFLVVRIDESGAPIIDGLMYLAGPVGAKGPQPFGSAFAWHVHKYLESPCFQFGQIIRPDLPPADCTNATNQGVLSSVTPEMLHIWLTDNPEGDFASQMSGAPHDH
ncbi:MAG: hypothetical protein KDB24_10650 [Microthrixaceae bacterium]|nr:hypothetical protein [Microthrixaceae bacterium]